MATDLLPPGSTPLERAVATATARVGDVPSDLGQLWNPETCPIALLPWLAWSLSIDTWSTDWSEVEKRASVAGAIALHRRKGTRTAIADILQSFDQLATLVEWFEVSPALNPYTFEIRLPFAQNDEANGQRMSAASARAIVREVTRVKPVRAHFTLVHEMTVEAAMSVVGAIEATGHLRLNAVAAEDDGTPWADLIQDENGEPLADDTGEFIDGSAA